MYSYPDLTSSHETRVASPRPNRLVETSEPPRHRSRAVGMFPSDHDLDALVQIQPRLALHGLQLARDGLFHIGQSFFMSLALR